MYTLTHYMTIHTTLAWILVNRRVRLYDNLFFLLLRDVLLHTEHICKIAFVPAPQFCAVNLWQKNV